MAYTAFAVDVRLWLQVTRCAILHLAHVRSESLVTPFGIAASFDVVLTDLEQFVNASTQPVVFFFFDARQAFGSGACRRLLIHA